MSVDLASGPLSDLPSFRALTESACEDLRNGRHVLFIGGGTGIVPAFVEAIEGALSTGSAEVRRILPEQAAESEPLERFLAATSDLPESGFIPGGGQRDEGAWIEQVLILAGADGLLPGRSAEWIRFVDRSARHGVTGPHSLLLPIDRWPAGVPVPASTPRLAIYHFWNTVSVLELRLLCRLREGRASPAESEWREAVVPSLVGTNLELLEYLWHDVLRTEAHLWGSLRELARRYGWDAAELSTERKRCELDQQATGSAPGSWEPLFLKGAAQATREYGPEVSVLALAAMEDRRAFQHRLWRAQASLLLPLLDQVRLRVCELLTERHGPSWPFQFATIRDEDLHRRVSEDPCAMDYGPLLHAVKQPAAKAQVLVPLVDLARDLRNELAHYRPVEFARFERLKALQNSI